MAMALTMDVPMDRPSPPADAVPVSTATAPEPFFIASLPQTIPPSGNIVQTPDTVNMATTIPPKRPWTSSQASPALHHVPLPPPPPMPDFVFPARPANSAPSSFSRRGRRPMSVADLQERTALPRNDRSPGSLSPSPALPDFVFNPGASLPPTPSHSFLTPLQPPQSPHAIPARPSGAGHRRGGSEFVGGSLRSGDAFTLMSTSPTKSESGLASPTLLPMNPRPSGSGPPPGRRGHAHRRSAAISSHDLSDILQPTSQNSSTTRGNSAPSSPSVFSLAEKNTFTFPGPNSTNFAESAPTPDEDFAAMMDVDDVVEKSAATQPSSPAEEKHQPSAAAKPLNRARVGFSDTLEFIPRPLSLISSDTSSTVTARPVTGGGSHSVSGSISSIISLNASISPGADRETLSPLGWSPTRNSATDSRPSTAGAVLDRTQTSIAEDDDGLSPRRRNSIPILSSLPTAPQDSDLPESAQSLPSPSKTPKRWSFFSLDPFISGSNTSPTRGSSLWCPAEDSTTETAVEGGNSPLAMAPETYGNGSVTTPSSNTQDDVSPSPSKSVSRKTSKKKKKAKSWSILTRKSKPRRKSRRTPTPPPVLSQAESDDDDSMDAHIDYPVAMGELNEGLVAPAVSASPSELSVEPHVGAPSFSTWEPLPSPSAVADEDNLFPMIDLDAALGPFNTPLPRNPEWEAAQKAGGLSKRQLHSAAGMTRFNGPGMHYSHRRAESAPEMPPFNRVGIPRFSSSTTMADVFEEEEEEDEAKEGSPSPEQDQQQTPTVSKPTSTHSTSTASTPPRRPMDTFTERPPSIDIRVTSSEGIDDFSLERRMDTAAYASDEAPSSTTRSRRGSGVSGLSDDDKTQASLGLKSQYSASSLQDDVIVEEGSDGGFLFCKHGDGTVKEGSSDFTMNSPAHAVRGRDLTPVDVSPLHLPAADSLVPASPYSMTPSSVVTSPRSPMSYDGNRVSTAPSSVADDNFRSLLMGEPGPEVRRSSDIPSLTSSNSTMTRESAAPYAGLGGQPRPAIASRGADRPASFTATAFGRRRSSLASLHRLVNTSHGERSKLSMEVQPDSASAIDGTGDPEKRMGKVSRTKRISRMVQFWKAKEETTP